MWDSCSISEAIFTKEGCIFFREPGSFTKWLPWPHLVNVNIALHLDFLSRVCLHFRASFCLLRQLSGPTAITLLPQAKHGKNQGLPVADFSLIEEAVISPFGKLKVTTSDNRSWHGNLCVGRFTHIFGMKWWRHGITFGCCRWVAAGTLILRSGNRGMLDQMQA
jgi:hypothetical protein